MFDRLLRGLLEKEPGSSATEFSESEILAEVQRLFPQQLEDPMPPLRLQRLAPKPDAGWPSSDSWLGGLPRLGEVPWPRGASQTPLHHLASVSLVEAAPLLSEGLLPASGYLSFFVGITEAGVIESRVIVTNGAADTSPPTQMPTVEDIFGDCERSDPRQLDRRPVRLFQKSWNADADGDSAMEAFRIWKEEFGAERVPIYWDSAYQLLRGLKSPLDTDLIAKTVASKAQLLEIFETRLTNADSEQSRESQRKNIENCRLVIHALKNKVEEYRDFVENLDIRINQHQRWQRMQADDILWLRDTFSELAFSDYSAPERNTHFGAIHKIGRGTVHGFDQAVSATYSSIVDTPSPVIDQLPTEVLELIQYEPGFAPVQGKHQMFGHPIDIQDDLVEFANHYLLLQIEYDVGAGLRIGDCGTLQFMIRPDDLAACHWDSVKTVFSGN